MHHGSRHQRKAPGRELLDSAVHEVLPPAQSVLKSLPQQHAAGTGAAVVIFQHGAVVKVLSWLMATVLLLHLMVVATDFAEVNLPGKWRFYLDQEGNLPSLFSTGLLFLAAVLLALIGRFKRAEKDPFARHWLVLASIFLALGADEALGFHEVLIDPLRQTFNLTGLLRFSWVLVGIPLVAALAFLYLPFLRSLPRRTCFAFTASGIVYVTGALGFEMIGGAFYDDFVLGKSTGAYQTVMTIEETLEMAGIVLFVRALLQYLTTYRPSFQVRIT
jgi:hypothetical protein